MFATREILTQSVLTEFTGQRIPEALAQKRVAVYRRMGLKVRAREGKMGMHS